MIRSAVFCVVVLGFASFASAQPAGAQAEVLFRQGRDLLAAGKIEEACNAFAESEKLEPAVTTLLNLAGCHEKQGKLATAWGEFLDASRQTRGAADKDSRQLHDVAEKRATALEPRVSKLAINVPETSNFDGLEIDRDGERVESVMWNRGMPIDGGTYTITARAPGANPWSTEVTVEQESDTQTVDIPDLRNLPRDLDPTPVVKKDPTPTPAVVVHATPHASAKSSKLPAILVGAGAIVLFGGAGGLELWGEANYDDAKSAMGAERDSLFQSANSKRYAAEGVAVAGVACAGVAVWMFLRHPHASSTEVAGVHVVASPTGFALIGGF